MLRLVRIMTLMVYSLIQPKYIEFDGPWAHIETPADNTQYLEGAYGNIDYR